MFTGLVEEMGTVIGIKATDSGIKIKISGNKVLQNGKIGDSIATNGVCLTAVEINSKYFMADIMNESVNRTNLKNLKVGDKVNLEKSLTLQSPLGGHLVTGDVDCVGIIKNIKNDGFAKIFQIDIPHKYMKYLVEKGRITVDGASLTLIDIYETSFTISIIPHTQEAITLGYKKIGDLVNIETDLIGKFVDRILNFKEVENTRKSKLTSSMLFENGFL
ncbi:riboflavin synthase alpha chain [Cetobacterium ceti]|uniref:Riboflavin synthase n=1 Tax=Cetobacterium ceti TaxID=180163 RepID=A0A1T4M817_9FUSO|nr:riboflavin synthase [Cetobacterium ceti]SJZ63153.1 riboflavin synthase alpha chain [Cetobacterium ceti]